jgi:hypothetical protein
VPYINLTKGYYALVSDEDSDLSDFNWYYLGIGYAARSIGGRKLKSMVYMHRVILERVLGRPLDTKEHVDHIDGFKLNNKRDNLRPCNQSQNLANYGLPTHNTSGYKGVGWFKRDKCWRAYITVNGQHMHLGLFDNIIDAARKYDEAARRYFGEFARLNFP